MSEVPCEVEQRALRMCSMRAVLLLPLLPISHSNISIAGLIYNIKVNQCSKNSLDYLDCLMRDKQKESIGSKVVQLVGLIFLLTFLDLGVSHLFIAANRISSARRQIRAETELRPASK